MKKISAILAALAISVTVFGQSAADALMMSQEYYEGTARSMAMGSAFTAVGGDLGAVAINPASSGIYRYSQFSFTPSLTITPYESEYLGNFSKGNNSRMTFSNAGFVASINPGNTSGLLNYNFSAVYNRKRTFNGMLSAWGDTDDSSMLSSIAASVNGYHSKDLEKSDSYNPYLNSSAPWRGILAWNTYGLATMSQIDEEQFPDIDYEYAASTENYDPDTKELFVADKLRQTFSRSTYGGIQEFTFNFGCNFSDKVFFGVNLNMEAVNYTEVDNYSEEAFDIEAFQDKFAKMSTSYWRQTTGAGFNMKFGLIATPVGGLRLGATFTTPTWYSLKDTWNYDMTMAFGNGKKYSATSATGMFNYRTTAPLRFSLGLAYTFKGFGLLSFEYERVDYSAARLKDNMGNVALFNEENSYIASNYGASNILRAGGEIFIKRLALRGGYNYYSTCYKSTGFNSYGAVSSWSCGAGLNITKRFSVDAVFQRFNMGSDTFQLYDDYYDLAAPRGNVKSKVDKVAVSLTFKF